MGQGSGAVNPLPPEHIVRKLKQDIDTFLFPFGYGDGGGGPTELMVETAERCRDLEVWVAKYGTLHPFIICGSAPEKPKVSGSQVILLSTPIYGGGGPTELMVETAERCRDLEGAPRCTMESPAAFFDRLDGSVVRNVYYGELYLAWHRGTYTRYNLSMSCF